jgi:hypothetical protein
MKQTKKIKQFSKVRMNFLIVTYISSPFWYGDDWYYNGLHGRYRSGHGNLLLPSRLQKANE